MSNPETDWVLSEIKTQWPSGSYSDIPLERVDREDSEKLDGGVRSRKGELQEQNFVGAALAERGRTPIGTEFDYDVEAVVGVRVEGLHHDAYGYIDPSASLPPSTSGDPVPWSDLVDAIQDAVQTNRTFPSVGRSDTSYTHVRIANESDRSDNYGDYYRADFDLVFGGYESPP
jgi:hypothetical protein